MYIMKAFITTDLPGEVARPIAALFFLWIKVAARCFSFNDNSDAFLMDLEEEEMVVEEDRYCVSYAVTSFIPSGGGNFWVVE